MARGVMRSPEEMEKARQTVLHTAAVLFLETGYTNTSYSKVTKASGLDPNSVFRAYGSKDNILAALVEYVLKRQFAAAGEMIAGKTSDPLLYYAAETVLQLHMAESSEHIRELYAAAYSLPATTDYIQRTIAGKLKDILSPYLPDITVERAFEIELASGGIMRSFMLVPCSPDFPMERKAQCFLESTFRVFQIPDTKIDEAVRFISQFDYPTLAKGIIDQMLYDLKQDQAAI